MKSKVKLISLITFTLGILAITYLAFNSLRGIDDDIFAVDFSEDIDEDNQ